MKNELMLSVFEIVASPLCVAASDGQKINDRISAALKEDRKVTLSFREITLITSAFLNAAIGQLYGDFDELKIRALLNVQDMQAEDLELLKQVVDTAKLYFSDPIKFNHIIDDVLEDEEGDSKSGKNK